MLCRFFFFFKQKTAYEMRISDWSSDVCSSDLVNIVDHADLSDFLVPAIVERGDITIGIGSNGTAPLLLGRIRAEIEALLPARLGDLAAQIGRESCRARVCQYV